MVMSLARYSHHLTLALKGFNQSLLVHRTCAGNNLEVVDACLELLVAKCGKLGTGDNVAVVVGVLPQSDLAANLLGSARGVARYNLDADASVDTLLDGGGHIAAHGVGNGCGSHKAE